MNIDIANKIINDAVKMNVIENRDSRPCDKHDRMFYVETDAITDEIYNSDFFKKHVTDVLKERFDITVDGKCRTKQGKIIAIICKQ